MVRLKVRPLTSLMNRDDRFNSNMVRLKVEYLPLTIRVIFAFQFQYGSIKSIMALSQAAATIAFQFQYGSIKRCGHRTRCDASAQFQFQYGSIKSLHPPNPHHIVECFNSNMVRLKGQDLLDLCTHTRCFNSNMVRLKACCSLLTPRAQVVSIPIWFD